MAVCPLKCVIAEDYAEIAQSRGVLKSGSNLVRVAIFRDLARVLVRLAGSKREMDRPRSTRFVAGKADIFRTYSSALHNELKA